MVGLLRIAAAAAALAGLLLAGPVAAAPDGLTLAAVIRAGLEQDPQAALPAGVRAEGEALRARASSLLAADPSLQLRHESDAAADNDGYRYWEGGVALPLWLPGQRDLQLQVADATEQEAAALSRLQHWRMAGEVRELLWSLAIAAAKLELAEQALASARQLQEDVEKRAAAGELARSEIILARKETLAQEEELGVARSEHDALLGKYRNTTGLQQLPATFTEAPPASSAIPDDHAALAAARVAENRAHSQLDQVVSERRGNPVLLVGGLSQRDLRNEPRDKALALELSVPFGLRSHAAPRTAAAQRGLVEAAIDVKRVRRELENERVQVLADAEQGARVVELAQRRQQLAEEGLRLARRAFELGESDLFTLLQAHRQALAARRDLRIGELGLDRAHARLNQVLGVIPE